MPRPPLRTYAAVAASNHSVVSSSSTSPPFLPPPPLILSLAAPSLPLDEEAFPTLGPGGGGSPLRRRRHWRSAEGRRRETEEGQVAVVEQRDLLLVAVPPPPSSTPEQPPRSIPIAYIPSTNSPTQNLDPQLSSSPPSAPSAAAQLRQPLTQLPIPPRPTLPPSPLTSLQGGLTLDRTLPRRPLNDSERTHLLQVLEVSRDALRRLEQRDQTREGRIGYLRSQIDAMETLLRGGEAEEEDSVRVREPGGRLGQVAEGGEEAESVSFSVSFVHLPKVTDLAHLLVVLSFFFQQMLPHSLLTGQMSLLRRRGAIHRNVPNPPLQLPSTAESAPRSPLPPSSSPPSSSNLRQQLNNG